MRKPKSSKTLWEASYAHPAVPAKEKLVMALIGLLAGILFGMALWGMPGGGV